MTNFDVNNTVVSDILTYISNILKSRLNSNELIAIINRVYIYSNELLKLSPIQRIENIEDDSEIIWGQLNIRNKKLIEFVKTTFKKLYLSESHSLDNNENDDIINDFEFDINHDKISDSDENIEETAMEEVDENEFNRDYEDKPSNIYVSNEVNDDENVDDEYNTNENEDDQNYYDDNDDEENDEGENDDEENDDDEYDEDIDEFDDIDLKNNEDNEKEMLEIDMLDDYDEDDNDDEENVDNETSKSKNDNNTENLTEYQRKQIKLKNKLSEIEKELIQPKKWDMLGEVKANARPENSLLEINADIDIATKPAPVITTEFTSSIEDVIKNRIKKRNFNDVIHKSKDAVKSTSDNEITISNEKSKVGLGEIYAEEFSKKVVKESINSLQKEMSKEILTEVKVLYDQVSLELDSLCHHFYTPVPLSKEIDVKALPVISYEENLPNYQSTNINDYKIDKRINVRTLKSIDELTKSDKLSMRKQKKRQMSNKENNKSESQIDRNINNKMKKIKYNNNGSDNIKYGSSKDVFKAMNEM